MVILAFPGTGKTSLSKLKGGFIDLDYDHFRQAAKKLSLEESATLYMYSHVAKSYARQGYTVLINEPAVLDETDLHVDRMYIPGCEHLRNNSAIKLGVKPDKIEEWIGDWVAAAAGAKVPVVFLTGWLVHYIRGNRR